MSENSILEFRLNGLFDILIPNLTNISVHVLKQMVLPASSESMVSIIDLVPVDEGCSRTVATEQAASKLPVRGSGRPNVPDHKEG